MVSKEEPTFKTRPRDEKKKERKAKFDFADILAGKLQVTLALSAEDRELIGSKIEEMSEKVDYRWKITQLIMVIGIVLAGADRIISYL
tara:strand:+ start:268 stop:531 length:264 start_codon:yes stop_codon:yes gene_type:complete